MKLMRIPVGAGVTGKVAGSAADGWRVLPISG
jgi:hypothetical protein